WVERREVLERIVRLGSFSGERGGATPPLRLPHHPDETAGDLAAPRGERLVLALVEVGALQRHVQPLHRLLRLRQRVRQLAHEVPLVPPLRPRFRQARADRPRGATDLARQAVRLLLRPRLRQREDALPHLDAQPVDSELLVMLHHQGLPVLIPPPPPPFPPSSPPSLPYRRATSSPSGVSAQASAPACATQPRRSSAFRLSSTLSGRSVIVRRVATVWGWWGSACWRARV